MKGEARNWMMWGRVSRVNQIIVTAARGESKSTKDCNCHQAQSALEAATWRDTRHMPNPRAQLINNSSVTIVELCVYWWVSRVLLRVVEARSHRTNWRELLLRSSRPIPISHISHEMRRANEDLSGKNTVKLRQATQTSSIWVNRKRVLRGKING